MRIRLTSDFLTGLLFVALGGFAILYGSRYPLGTAARMGPGYFPLLASTGLVILGLILLVRSFLKPGEALAGVHLRPLFFILLGTLAFGLLIERAGFIVSALAVVFCARAADRDFRPLEVALLAGGLIVFTLAIFRFGLGMNLKLLPF